MNTLPFRPIIGSEQKILETSEHLRNGLLGITTDTNRIYYGKDQKMHLIGSKSNIYYGRMSLTETPDVNQKEFLFNLEQIEGNEFVEDGNYIIPNESDLILNIPDGCFYKIIEIIQDNNAITLNTTKLTISGTGGGGNTPGGTTGSTAVFNRITNRDIEVLYGASCEIWYEFLATDNSGEQTGAGQVEVIVNGATKQKLTQSQGRNFVDVGKYLSLAENQSVVIKVTVDVGSGVPTVMTKSWSVTTRNITLVWNPNETKVNKDDTITLSWTVSGAGEKTTYIIIDGDETNPITITSSSTTLQTYSINRKQYGLNHGVHTIKMYVKVHIGGNQIPPTESITKYFICADEGEKSVIIANLLKDNQVTQYDTLEIPLVIYNPTSDTSEVELYNDAHDVEPIDTWNEVSNETKKMWSYTPTTAGEKRLKVRCGSTNLIIDLIVNALGIDVDEISNPAFKLKASEITSNDALRALTKADGTKLLTFSSNFDWIRGGLKSELDENGNSRQYICIPAGSTMTINHSLMAQEAATYGKNIKVIFKAVNCRKYDGTAMVCGDVLKIDAQQSTLTFGDVPVEIPYCEDSYLELEYDIWAVNDEAGVNDGYRYVVGWLDGVPCCAVEYTQGSLFATSAPLVIGSADCDVYLYLLKSYDRHLTDDEHIKNFIADAPNSNEMLSRYRRNDILDENGEISYLKLAKAAPNCRVHVYEIPRMTLNKEDKVSGCSYTMYHGSSDAVVSSVGNVTVRVQGTSSEAYGVSAFNIDSDFKKAIEKGDFTKEQLTNAVLGDKAIPCNYFTTKVNVASCEGANNAINQEWYNLHQPYQMSIRKKNKEGGWNGTGRLYRDTMQFEPGVMFVIDHNTETDRNKETGDNVFKDTPGYINNPYAKMYAVCNMGNSKKNLEVFHDISNPRECCVEVSDNQLVEQRMLHYRDMFKWDTEKWAWTSLGVDGVSTVKVFEFRYPDAKDTYTEGTQEEKDRMDQMRLDWERFYTWMGQCNLQPKSSANPNGYDENVILDMPIIFEPFTVSQDGLLKGTTINAFAGEYTHDTKEYRMAKMLSECEDYLCLDSIIYHFLMIERHSMVDNVAKNTFWSTEDGLHWNLNKDYDNDTADGIDNNGLLKLTYGVEAGDKDAGGTPYFNAAPTVWFNFAKELLPLQTKMYIELSQSREDDLGNTIGSAWSTDQYLKRFIDWQDCIPERCWVEDYYRKYFRPAEVYGDKTYLPRLDGGKKTHQRKQYEIYQHNYIDSKFGGPTTTSNNIQLRANAEADINGDGEPDNITIPLELYADCYLNAAIGSGTGQTAINYRRRVKRGETVNFVLNITGDLTDATCYFYLPQYYTKIGDLSAFQPKLISINNAKKLRELTFGDQYENTEVDAAITISTNAVPLLEKLIAKKIKSLGSNAKGLDLSNAYSLEEIDLTDSAFSSIVLPDGAPLKIIKFNKPTNITASNLYSVEQFELQDAKALQNIQLDNVDNENIRMSQIIVDKMLDSNATELQAYKLHNINWDINNSSDIIEQLIVTVNLTESTYEDGKYYIKSGEDYILANDGYNENETYYEIMNFVIPLFDYLLKLSENKSNVLKPPHEPWMTGKVDISQDAYNSSHSLDFYNKYVVNGLNNDSTKRYPEINLNFEGNLAKLYNVNIYYGEESEKRLWSKKAVSGTLINGAFLSTGPQGAFDISKVYQSSSLQYDYVFTGKWNIYNANTNALLSSGVTDLSSCNFAIKNDIKVIPQFTTKTRKYPVIFYNDDGTTVLNDLSSTEDDWVEYGTPIRDIVSKVIPTSSQDSSTLLLNESYVFKGYSVVKNSSNVVSNDYIIEGAETLYAVYELMDIYNADFSKYFNATLDEFDYQDPFDSNYNTYGYRITPNKNYKLSGKIIIPSYINGTPVTKIGKFTDAGWNITHIFLDTQDVNQIRVIEADAFDSLTSLRYFDFTKAQNLRRIEQEAFLGTSLDMTINSQLGGPNTYYFGNRAFYSIKTGLANAEVKVPASVSRMGHQVFMGYSSTLKISIGSATQKSQLDLGLSLTADSDNFVRVEASEIKFYTDKYSNANDSIKQNSTLSVGSLLKASNSLSFLKGD